MEKVNKKYFIIVIILLLIILIGIFASIKLNKKEKTNEIIGDIKAIENIKMEVKEKNKESITIVINDTSRKDNIYGEWFRVDKLDGNKWEEVKTIDDNYSFLDTEYTVEEEKLEFSHNWKFIYGALDEGEYRIVKKVNNKDLISATFEIEN